MPGDHHRRGEDLVALRLFGRRRFAGEGVLVDHRHAFDDLAVDRHDFAGLDDDDVADVQLIERSFDFDAVPQQPDEARLLAEDVQQHFLGVVLRLLEQHAAEAQAPRKHRAGEDLTGRQAGRDDDRVEHVDAQPLLLEKHAMRVFETRDDRVDEEHGAHGQDNGSQKLSRGRDADRHCADGKVEIDRRLFPVFAT